MKPSPAYITGQLLTGLVALVVGAALSLALFSLAFVAGKVSWWLITEHPLVALAAALVGVLAVGRKL